MLEALRRSTGGFLAKILIGLLVLSFAVWGIADVFTGGGNAAVATVGDTEIQPQEFEQAYRNELNTLSRQTGRRITPDEARAIGLDRRVLSRLIGSSAIEAHAEELNLQLSDQTLVDGLKTDPQYQDARGNFSPSALKNMLAQIGMSERGFLSLRRQDEVRDQIVGALLNSTAVPAPMVDILHGWRGETRVIEHITIDVDKVIKLPEVTEDELKKTYEQNKSKFMIPELRQMAMAILSADKLAKKADITEDAVKTSYDETKDTYDTPEKRQVQQIPFPDKAAAEAARKALDDGKLFKDVAKEAGASEKDIELGLLEKKSLIDPTIADAAFSLKENNYSDVVEGKFVTVLLRVTKIEPGVQKTFADVKDDVRDKLSLEIAMTQIQKLYDDIDEARGSGSSLEVIAKEFNLEFRDIPGVSLDNTDADGKKVVESRDGALMVQEGFRAEVGIERPPVQISDGGYAWIDLIGINPPKQKTFDQVKDDVKKLWSENTRRRMLSEIAAKSVQRIRNGEDFAKIGTELGGTPTKTPEISRTTIPQGMTQAAITQAFLLPINGASSAATDGDKSRSVFRVLEIKKAEKPTDEERKGLDTELQRQLQRDLLSEYVEGLQKSLGVSINEVQFGRATGADTSSY